MRKATRRNPSTRREPDPVSLMLDAEEAAQRERQRKLRSIERRLRLTVGRKEMEARAHAIARAGYSDCDGCSKSIPDADLAYAILNAQEEWVQALIAVCSDACRQNVQNRFDRYVRVLKRSGLRRLAR